MPVTTHNIPTLPAPQGFSHVSVARGRRIIHVSGQPATDEGGAVVPGGLAAQTERAMLNVALALEVAGASVDDLAKVTFYVVGWAPSMYHELARGGEAARVHHPFPEVATTLVGVQSLFTPEMLIEIEAVAVVD